MELDPADQQFLTEEIISLLEPRSGQLNDLRRIPDNAFRQDPYVTGLIVHSEEGNDYSLAIQDVRASPVVERVHSALAQDEMSALQSAAEALADAGDSGGSFGDVYDPGRSSSGEECITSPDSAGFYTLVAGRPAQVTVSYVTDPEMIDEVLAELDDEHFETDSGTPPEADVDDIPGSCDISGG